MLQLKLLTPLLWLLALSLAAWTFTQLPLAAIGTAISALSPNQFGLWFGLNLVIILVCNYRWHLLNRMIGLNPGFVRLLSIRQAGQAISFITPGPQFGGEPLQVYWLHRLGGLALGKTVLALGLDRFFELWTNLSILLLGLAMVLLYSAQHVTAWPELVGILLLLICGLFLLLWLLLRQPQWLGNSLQRLARRWHKHPRLLLLENAFQAMSEQLGTALRMRKMDLLWALLLSVLSWTGLLVELWLVLGFVDIHPDLPGFFLILVALRLAFLLPLPGAIGTLEASLFWSLQSLGVPAGAVLGVIALMRLRDAMVLGIGLLCLRVVQTGNRASRPTGDEALLADVVQPG